MQVFNDSPDSLLASLTSGTEPGRLIIVTSPSGSGKTRWCLALADHAVGLGISVGGLVCAPQWWRGLQLLLLTILTNALHRSEDIVLAAEARAFHPDRSQSAPLRIGRLDWWLAAAGLLSVLGVLLI